MSPNLTQLIEQSAALSPQERLELATHLQSPQNTPDRWDLSEAAIAKRNVEMRQVLAEWRETGDEVEQTETWEELKVSLDLDPGQRSLVLETITNLRSQQPSFKTPKEIDAEILEEKALWVN
jgi:hypothetical protein